MKIRTVDSLTERIYSDLAWRRRELTTFRACVEKADLHAQGALMRSSLALLYAHWEGFVKFSGHAYLCYLAAQRLAYRQLRPEIAAVALRTQMGEFFGASKAELHGRTIEQIRENSADRARIPTAKDAVRTNSNLNSDTLREILCALGLDYVRYNEYAAIIDDQLVAVRNRIAHGEQEYVRLPEWEEIRGHTMTLMSDVAEQIVTSANEKLYLARPN